MRILKPPCNRQNGLLGSSLLSCSECRWALGYSNPHSSAKSLYALVNIATIDPCCRILHVEPAVLALCSGSRDLAFRHGALLALAHVMRALRTFDDNYLSAQLSTVVPSLNHRLYRGRDGDLWNPACSFIAALASCSCPLNAPTQLRLLGSLDDSSGHALETVRTVQLRQCVLSRAILEWLRTQTALLMSQMKCYYLRPYKYLDIVRKGTTASLARGSCNCLGALPAWLVVRDKST